MTSNDPDDFAASMFSHGPGRSQAERRRGGTSAAPFL
jgi:hypothetical protein